MSLTRTPVPRLPTPRSPEPPASGDLAACERLASAPAQLETLRQVLVTEVHALVGARAAVAVGPDDAQRRVLLAGAGCPDTVAELLRPGPPHPRWFVSPLDCSGQTLLVAARDGRFSAAQLSRLQRIAALGRARLDHAAALHAARDADRSAAQWQQRFSALALTSSDMVIRLDGCGRITEASPVTRALLGWAPESLVGQALTQLLPDEERDLLRAAMGAARTGVTPRPLHHTMLGADGSPRRVQSVLTPVRDVAGAVVEWVCTTRWARRRSATSEASARDDLTGLPGRQALVDALAHCAGAPAALYTFDLDRFGAVNDTLGHRVGDQVLVEIGRRLAEATRPGDLVVRLSGDEFAVLARGVGHPADALRLAERLRDRMMVPLQLPGTATLTVTVSVGVAVTGSAEGSDRLPRESGLALAQAKAAGRDRVALYDTGLHERALERLDAERRLRRALASDGLRLEYQPVVDLASRRVVGAEALLRVHDPELGVLPPASFIEVAEGSGLISEVDTWVLGTALKQAAAWRDGGSGDALAHMAVNVSSRSLLAPGFPETVSRLMAHHRLPGSFLQLEVTERTLLEASGAAVRAMAALAVSGIRIGIDDFGTGYSALAYLRRFDLDFLKLDRSFVADLSGDTDPRATAVVAAVVSLAHALSLGVIAEGVETEEQCRVLETLGCTRGQGWLFARSLPPAELAALLVA